MQVHVYGGVLPYGLQELNGTATGQVTSRTMSTCPLPILSRPYPSILSGVEPALGPARAVVCIILGGANSGNFNTPPSCAAMSYPKAKMTIVPRISLVAK